MGRYMRRTTYWTPAEMLGALVFGVGALVVTGLLWRLGLYVLVPFVMVAVALGWAWAISGE